MMELRASFMNTINLMSIYIFICSFIQSEYVQYGFAHRVNTPSNIKYVLDAGANGIEIDVCSRDDYTEWYVSHNDKVPFNLWDSCKCDDCYELSDWLRELKVYLDNNELRKSQLAMIWIDIKTPQDVDIKHLPNIIHSAELPEDIKILYDLTNFNANSVYGFNQIVNTLRHTEGISFMGDNSGQILDIYNFYKSKQFTRGTFNYGNAVGMDENILAYARKPGFMKSSQNPYGFALTLTWTNALESSIKDHTDPNDQYYTDGQIYGNAFDEWSNDNIFINRFNKIISEQDNTRLATTIDDPFQLKAN